MFFSHDGNSSKPMTSSRPYIVRALHEWIVDNELTPYLMVNALAENVQVPQQYVENGKIVLNISPSAVKELIVNRQHVEFEARFRGVLEYVYVPMSAVMAIYAKENGRGMAFEEEDNDLPPPPSSSGDTGGDGRGAPVGKGGKGHLKVVK